jgi:cytochrome P450
VVALCRPDYVQAALVDRAADFDNMILPPVARAVGGSGLFAKPTRTQLHQHHRRILQPLFTPRQVTGWVAAMVDHAGRIERGWSDGQNIELGAELTRITLGAAGAVLFGAELSDRAGELRATLNELFELLDQELRRPLHWPMWWPTRHNRRARALVARLDRVLLPLIRARRRAPSERADLLALLLEARHPNGSLFDERQVRDHAMNLFIAAHEETAVALGWTLYLLARHPRVYQRVLDELDRALDRRPPAAEDLERMPFAHQVIQEALRLYPPIDMTTPRVAWRASAIDGYSIPRGTMLMISFYALHRLPEHFPEPEAFDPERFALAAAQKLPRCAYLPFGAGERGCLGQHFATLELRLLLATLSQRVRFEPAKDQPAEPHAVFTTRPRAPVRMIVRRRSRTADGA